MTGKAILRDDVDYFVQVLNRATPDRVRLILRDAYGMDGPASARKSKGYDRCREMLMKLRQDSSWSISDTWDEKKDLVERLILF